MFCFWDNCIWIGMVKFSVLRTWYFSSAANVLISSPKIFHLYKRDFSRLNWLGSDQWIRWKCCDADFNSSWARLPCCLLKVPLQRNLLDIYHATFSESVISKMKNLSGSAFAPKCLKFKLDFKNARKNWEKVFCFWDNWIWIGIVKLSLLRTGYFSSAANMLTSSPKILHITNWDVFHLNFFDTVQ